MDGEAGTVPLVEGAEPRKVGDLQKVKKSRSSSHNKSRASMAVPLAPCYRSNWASAQKYVGVPTPSTSESDFIWGQSLYRGNQVRMRSSGQVLFQYDWRVYKKGQCGSRQAHGAGTPCEDKGDVRGMLLEAKERVPKIASHMPEVRGDAWSRFFFTAPRRNRPCPDLNLRLGVSRSVTSYSSSVSDTQRRHFVAVALANEHTPKTHLGCLASGAVR